MNFLVKSLGFYACMILSFVNRDSSAFFLSNLDASFSCLWLELAKIYSIEVMKVDFPVLILVLEERL